MQGEIQSGEGQQESGSTEVSPESVAFWGDAQRRSVRVLALQRGGFTALVLGLLASLACTVAWLSSDSSFWRTFGPTSLFAIVLLGTLLLVSLLTVTVDRQAGMVSLYRSPFPILKWTSDLASTRIDGKDNSFAGMGSLGQEYRVYLRVSGGHSQLLYKGRGGNARTRKMIEKFEMLLSPPD